MSSQNLDKQNSSNEKARKFVKEKLILTKEDWLREMQAYADQENASIKAEVERLREVLGTFIRYYNSDFFHVSATQQEVFAEWVVKVNKLLSLSEDRTSRG